MDPELLQTVDMFKKVRERSLLNVPGIAEDTLADVAADLISGRSVRFYQGEYLLHAMPQAAARVAMARRVPPSDGNSSLWPRPPCR